MDMFGDRRPVLACLNILLLIFMGWSAMIAPAEAQTAEIEEIVVNFSVPRLIDKDLFVQYDGRTVFLSVTEVFDLLELNLTRDLTGKYFHGYLLGPDDEYEINLDRGEIKAKDREFSLTPGDYCLTPMGLYLRLDLFETCFGLKMHFDFSNLRVNLPLDKQFPAYQKLKRRADHEKLTARETVLKDVHRLPFKRELFTGGVGDWMISANPLGDRRVQHFNLNLGGMLLGGDLLLSGTGDTEKGFDSDQFRYQWHYFFDHAPYLTQAEIGRVSTSGQLSRSLEGALITNRPQAGRKYFQTIDVSGVLGEGWEVELYVDNKLTDFMYTDQTGRYNFNVDIYYGSSLIMLKMYGPNGEYKTEDVHVRVPHNLIPKGEIEYTVAAGKSDIRDEQGWYGQANWSYGISSRLTAGLSAELPLQTDYEIEPLYAAEAVVQPIRNMTVRGSVIPGYSIYGGINYSRPSTVNFDAGYTRYTLGHQRNRLDQIDNCRISVSSPLKLGDQRLNLRGNVSVDRFPNYLAVNATYGFSSSLSRFHVNYIGKYKMSDYQTSNRAIRSMSSQLLLSARLLNWLQPQFRVDYDHDRGEMTKYGVYLARRIFRTGQLTLSYERNQLSGSNMFMLTFNIYTSFAGFTTRAMASETQVSLSQIQRGSIRYDGQNKSVHFDRRNGVGFGSAVVCPFLDNNFNGIYDAPDESISGLKAKIRGSSGRPVGEDRIYYYDRLRPYDDYLVEIDEYSLDNPLLKPTHGNYSVAFNPNVVTAIRVPMVMAGEISGSVARQVGDTRAGQGGIRIKIMNLTTESQTEITTFNDGEYYYMGLIPGTYQAYIDPDQLKAFGYTSEPPVIDFEVKTAKNGDVVENIDFLLIPAR